MESLQQGTGNPIQCCETTSMACISLNLFSYDNDIVQQEEVSSLTFCCPLTNRTYPRLSQHGKRLSIRRTHYCNRSYSLFDLISIIEIISFSLYARKIGLARYFHHHGFGRHRVHDGENRVCKLTRRFLQACGITASIFMVLLTTVGLGVHDVNGSITLQATFQLVSLPK